MSLTRFAPSKSTVPFGWLGSSEASPQRAAAGITWLKTRTSAHEIPVRAFPVGTPLGLAALDPIHPATQAPLATRSSLQNGGFTCHITTGGTLPLALQLLPSKRGFWRFRAPQNA